MYTYQNGTAALQMPSNYVPLTEEEMTYVEGGFRIANWIVGGAMNLAISAVFGGIGNLLTKIGKRAISEATACIFAKNVKNKLMAKGISAVAAGTASKIAAGSLTLFAAVADPGMFVAKKIDASDRCGKTGYWDI